MISDAARQVPESLLYSTEIALTAAVLCLLLGAPAAFVFARYAFPGKKPAFLFLILSPLVPTVALVTLFYMTVGAMGLLGSKLGIVMVHTIRALPLILLILSVFFRRIPKELFEAAIIDGCSRRQLFLKIACPAALPSIAATGLFAF